MIFELIPKENNTTLINRLWFLLSQVFDIQGLKIHQQQCDVERRISVLLLHVLFIAMRVNFLLFQCFLDSNVCI